MLQVAGRAGRRSDGGEVVIQTSEPGHPVIRQVVAGDFAGMARMQLSERKAFFLWTVDEEEDMRYFIDLGVDYITTDYPERLQALLK